MASISLAPGYNLNNQTASVLVADNDFDRNHCGNLTFEYFRVCRLGIYHWIIFWLKREKIYIHKKPQIFCARHQLFLQTFLKRKSWINAGTVLVIEMFLRDSLRGLRSNTCIFVFPLLIIEYLNIYFSQTWKECEFWCEGVLFACLGVFGLLSNLVTIVTILSSPSMMQHTFNQLLAALSFFVIL